MRKFRFHLCPLMKQLLLIPVLILCAACALAQDPHFSQFFSSPLTLNPALTGKFNGTLRVAGNYRDQWPAISKAFITSTVSVDAPILTNRLPISDVWGIGVMALTDRTANGILKTNYASVSTAYHKGLDEDGNHQIGVGFQGTYVNRRLDGLALKFSDGLQLDGTWRTSPTEPINQQVVNITYFDVNAGLLYNGSTNGENNFYAGVSLYHINRPKETFTGGNYVLNPRFTAHAGGGIPTVDGTKTIYFNALYSNQAGANEFVAGGAVSFLLAGDDQNPTNFYAGSWARFNNETDAIIPYLGLDFNNFSLGVTYDVNISSLRTGSQSRGGLEVSLIYIKRHPDGRRGIKCPRY
jgi:type IX secretion system PorP/SprF family membrane protein